LKSEAEELQNPEVNCLKKIEIDV